MIGGRVGRVVGRAGRALEHPAVLPALLLAGVIFVGGQVAGAASGFPLAAYDSRAYHIAAGNSEPYRTTIDSGFDDSTDPYKYRYPPPLAQVLWPAQFLPWPVFAGLWIAMLYLVFLAIDGRWALPLLLFPPVLGELSFGNVNLLVALAIMVGMRWPAARALVLLRKITPGIGLLWFVARGEWRSLAIALVTTAGIALGSFILAPELWVEFRRALDVQAEAATVVPQLAVQVALPIRLAIACAIVVFAARMDQVWLVPIAATIAAPVLWVNVLVVLIAVIPLAEGRSTITLPGRARRATTLGAVPVRIVHG